MTDQPQSTDIESLRDAVRRYFESGYADYFHARSAYSRISDTLRLQETRRMRGERDHFLNSAPFSNVLAALVEVPDADKTAVGLIAKLCKLRGERSFIDSTKPEDVLTSAQRMERGRRSALEQIVRLSRTLGPNYQPVLASLYDRVTADPWPTMGGHLWLVDLNPELLSKRGAKSWRGVLVAELDRLIPSHCLQRAASIAALLRLAGDDSIQRQHVRAIVTQRLRSRSAK